MSPAAVEAELERSRADLSQVVEAITRDAIASIRLQVAQQRTMSESRASRSQEG